MLRNQGKTGFTIVELLIVIVVIGILAALALSSFSRAQEQARLAKINSDLAALDKTIRAARIASGGIALRYITGSTATASPCMYKPAGTDLATLDKETDTCWTTYRSSLQKISDASTNNITDLVDPWGRPYFIDENEQEGTSNPPCGLGRDRLGVFSRPLTGTWSYTNYRDVPYITPGC